MRITGIAAGLAITAVSILQSDAALAQTSLEGIWNPSRAPGMVSRPLESEVRLTPEGRAEFEAYTPDKDPTLRCLMPGVPLGILDPYPLEIVQQEHQILFLYEHFHQVRRIFMDGRQAPDSWEPSLMGFSVGRWEDDTLVVTTTHLSPDNYMWNTGLPFSGDEEAYAIERYTSDGEFLTLRAEVYDPRYYEEPYVMNGRRRFDPEGEIWEYECIPEFGGINIKEGYEYKEGTKKP